LVAQHWAAGVPAASRSSGNHMALIETIPVKEDYRRKIAQQLMREGMSSEPVLHWAQGLGRLGQAALGGYQMYQADQRDKENEAAGYSGFANTLERISGGGMPAPQQATATPPAPMTSVNPQAGAVPAALMGERPGGPVQPSARVWGDKEAEAAGLYEPSTPTKTAALSPMVPTPVKTEAIAPTPVAPVVPTPTAPEMDAAKAKLSQMVAILRDPNIPLQEKKQTAKVAEMLANGMLKPRDQWVTERSQDGSIYQRNSLTGEMKAIEKSDVLPQAALDQKLALARANKPETTINNIGPKAESKFAEKNAEHQSKRFNELIDGGADAKGMISNVQALRDIGSRITTGKTAETTALLGPYAESLGIKIDGLDDIQAYKSIVSRIAPQMRVPGSGTSSDMDVKMFLESLPGLGKTPGGNEIISQTLDAFAQHKIAASEIASRAVSGEISARDAEKELRALPDPLTLWKKARGKPNEPLGADKAALKSKYGLD
jgi:hypothetical protein